MSLIRLEMSVWPAKEKTLYLALTGQLKKVKLGLFWDLTVLENQPSYVC